MLKSMKNICRTCMVNSAKQSDAETVEMVSIFVVPAEAQEENLSLKELLTTTVPQLEIRKNDVLPENVCKKCSDKIIDIYNFQQTCLRIEEKLHELLTEDDVSNNFFKNNQEEEEQVVKMEITEIFLEQNNSLELMEKEFNTEDNSNSVDNFLWDENDATECPLNTIKKESIKKTLNKIRPRSSKREAKSKQPNTKERLYSCGKCQRRLKSKLSLIKHQELHLKKDKEEEELKCNICNQAFSEISKFKDHQRSHIAEKPFLCSECGKGFTSAGNLKTHSFRHLEKKLYRCSDCPKSFPTNGDLLCHYEIHKNKPRIHVCETCGRSFYKKFHLKQHQRYHSDEKPFACEFCEKRFVTIEKQRRHMRTHTGEKPYRCKYCERAFAQSNDCVKHLRQHIGDNVYQCELCPLRFPLARDLRTHFASHKDDDDETRSRNLKARLEEEGKMQIKLCS